MYPEPIVPVPLDILWRFWSFVEVKGQDDCWNWRRQGNRNYGNFTVGKENYLAHRFSYLIFKGPFDVELVVRHTCDNARCVNPAHLVLGTQSDNKHDGIERERNARGESHGNSVLTLEQAIQIKRLLAEGLSYIEVAKLFNVSPGCINNIKRGESWGWV